MDSGLVAVEKEEARLGAGSWPPSAPSSGNDLVVAAVRGDRAAVGKLVRDLAPRVFDTVRSICGPTNPDVDDLAQEALVGLVKALPHFEFRSSIGHYAGRIAARTAIAGRRRARAAGRMDEAALAIIADTTTKQPYRQLVVERRRAMVRMLLDELPEAQSEALAMRACLGLSMEEIAEATDTPINTVYSRLRLAKAALRARIEHDPVLADLSPENSR